MTEKKWTPGPWSIYKKSKKMTVDGSVHLVCDKDGFPPAFVPAWDCPSPGEVDGAEEALANAHLIAAAPDLYEALDMARVWLEFDGRFDMQGINAALAKARGEK